MTLPRTLTVAMLSVLLSGCGISRTGLKAIKITDGCTIEIFGLSKERMDAMLTGWDISPDCTVVVRSAVQ